MVQHSPLGLLVLGVIDWGRELWNCLENKRYKSGFCRTNPKNAKLVFEPQQICNFNIFK
jgi:hypothetical protein